MTATQQLIQDRSPQGTLMRRDVVRWVVRERAKGASYAAIARRIESLTQVVVTGQTLRNWELT